MTPFRFVPLALALSAASALVACSTAPTQSMGTAPASMAAPDHMADMDAQMKTMRDVHAKMMSARSDEERSRLMPAHMKSMQDGMAMMGSMDDMKGMPTMQGMTGEMATHHQMMHKRMQMMQTMMTMMKDRMPAAPAK